MSFASIVANIVSIVDRDIIPTFFALAFLFFLAGIARYFILGQGNPESREKGQKMMLWGIIGFVVLFGIWGIINFLIGTATSITGVTNQ